MIVPMRSLLLVLAFSVVSSTATAQDPCTSFPIRFAVAHVDGEPVVDAAWLETRLRWANRIFETAGVGFEAARIEPLDDAHATLENRRDRHALGALLVPDVINVFVVASLRDVDDPSRMRQGVHWRPRGYPGAHLVIVSQSGGETVLAHELGHFFGNRQHSETPGNIMSYDRGDGAPFLDDAQIAIIRRFARRFVRTREIRCTEVSARTTPRSGTSRPGERSPG